MKQYFGKYIGKDEIREVLETDLTTPSGAKVSEIMFLSNSEIVARELASIVTQRDILTAELKARLPEDEAKRAELDGQINDATTKIDILSERQKEMVEEERSILVSAKTLKEDVTDEPSDGYFEKRKHAVVEDILRIMAERNLQDVEIGAILQGVEQSYKQNVLNAVGAKFGRKQTDMNMLDYHYAINGEDRDNA